MHSLIESKSARLSACGVGIFKSAGVMRFTRLSVHWAESITAIKSSKSLENTSSVLAPLKCSKKVLLSLVFPFCGFFDFLCHMKFLN